MKGPKTRIGKKTGTQETTSFSYTNIKTAIKEGFLSSKTEF